MNSDSISYYIHAEQPLQAQAQALSREFEIEIIDNPVTITDGILISVEQSGLILRELPLNSGRSYKHEFANRFRSEGKDPFLRAIGAQNQLIWDLTAGWCMDAWHLCNNGHTVKALEKNPVVFAMLRDALARVPTSTIRKNLSLSFGKAQTWLNQSPSVKPDVIYLDPMYPQKQKKSAAVIKRLQFLQLMCEETDDQTKNS